MGNAVLGRWAVVLDVGKTLAKLTLWTDAGVPIDRRIRANQPAGDDYLALDVAGIETWLAETLSDFARMGPIGTIIPVGHGAAAAIIRDGKLVCPPLDYEVPLVPGNRADYEVSRDPFAATGSPSLPLGLNLGAQLDWLEARYPRLLDHGAIILPWAQYWAWLLSGVAASEVSSLGCHTDLWLPGEACPSQLAYARGWASRLAPLRRADAILGAITPEWIRRTGLSSDVSIYCGLHDSNAALLAARAFPEIGTNDTTVLSTGTWFVAMRSPGPGDLDALDFAALPEDRDCLVNVDVEGCPIPSARFMGGREAEILLAAGSRDFGGADRMSGAKAAIVRNAMMLPTLTFGVGPFPHCRGGYEGPDDPAIKAGAVGLYLALVADASLDLVGACERIVIEGRFADDPVFVAALAALRPADQVLLSHAHNSVPYGALRLVDLSLKPLAALSKVQPLSLDMLAYRSHWRSAIDSARNSA